MNLYFTVGLFTLHSLCQYSQCWNYGGPRARPPNAIVGPLIGEKKQAPGKPVCGPLIGLLLSETRAIKAPVHPFFIDFDA